MVVGNVQRESARFAATRYLDAISGLVGLIFYTNLLSPTSVGLYFTGMAVFKISAGLSNGLYNAVKKRGSEDEKDLSKFYTIAITGSIIYSILIVGLISAGYILLTSDSLPLQYKVPKILLYGVLIQFVPEIIYRANVTGYEASGNVAATGYYDLLRGIIETIIQVLLLIFISESILYLFVGSAVSTVAVGFLMYVKLQQVELTSFEFSDVLELKDFGLWSSTSSILVLLEERLTTIILSAMISPSAAGIYGIVLRTTRPALYLSKALSKSLLVETSYKKSTDEQVTEKLKPAVKYAPILAIPMAFGSIGLSEEILRFLYSNTYPVGGLIFVFMSIAVIFKSESKVLESYLYGLNKPKTVGVSSFLNLVISISILVVGLLTIGIYGLLISIVTSRLVQLLFLYRSTRSLNGIRFDVEIIYQFISAGVMLLLVILLKNTFQVQSYLLIPVVALGGIFYFTGVSILDKEFRNKVFSFINEKFSES